MRSSKYANVSLPVTKPAWISWPCQPCQPCQTPPRQPSRPGPANLTGTARPTWLAQHGPVRLVPPSQPGWQLTSLRQLANRAKRGPFTSLPAMAAVRFLFKNVDMCTISENHAFQACPHSHCERIAFIQHGLFRIVPSTRHHPVTRKSCDVIPSVAASHRYASQPLEKHEAARDSFPAHHRPISTFSTKKFYTL